MTVPTPLAGLKVVEFTHMVMGPAAGAILASLGAEVVRVEPPGGDQTRNLIGSGAGYFPMYNRHKASVCLDLKSADGLATALFFTGADRLAAAFRFEYVLMRADGRAEESSGFPGELFLRAV